MEETGIIALMPQDQDDSCLHRASLHPSSPIPSPLSASRLLQLTPQTCTVERGPRFKEYSDLRDRKLRMKLLRDDQTPEVDGKVQSQSVLTPPKKQVKFSPNFTTPKNRLKPPSFLAQSVPDFSSALRKENRRPPMVHGKVRSGSKSEKRGGSKSYANMERF